jgi:type II secretory pathway pseudopilin PulG
MLIELLIAMTVMTIGIAALVAGFNSGILSVNRGRLASGSATVADTQMEFYRQAAFTSLPVGSMTWTKIGPDGHTYWMQANGIWSCAIGTYSAGSCSGTPASRPVKLITITVRDGSSTAPVLFTESGTFDSSTG